MHAACTHVMNNFFKNNFVAARPEGIADLATYLTHGAATCSRHDSLMISKLWVCSMYMVLLKKRQH
jgi:hypothetical protein